MNDKPDEIAELARVLSREADRQARVIKAERILRVLRERLGDPASLSCLEIGTGSGVMSGVFARAFARFVSIDVRDLRPPGPAEFPFCLVGTQGLPFSAASFDVIVSAHVLQYIQDQDAHLIELQRMLKPRGLCYLATANRFALVEPHFGLPLLGWLSRPLAGVYLRMTGRGRRYGIHARGYRATRRTLARRFACQDITLELIKGHARYGFEDMGRIRYAARLPRALLAALEQTIMTSWVFLLSTKPKGAEGSRPAKGPTSSADEVDAQARQPSEDSP